MKNADRIRILGELGNYEPTPLLTSLDRVNLAPRLQRALTRENGTALVGTIENSRFFLSLEWLRQDGSRILTPSESPNNLRAVAERAKGLTLDYLCTGHGWGMKHHDPAWFQPCREIYEKFNYECFTVLAITPPPGHTDLNSGRPLAIFEGQHRTLALALRLLEDADFYKPVRTLILLPGRDSTK